MTSTTGSSLEQLLNLFWLRPETALWRQIDIQAMENFIFDAPSLDLGCGDGLFSFTRAGGRLTPDFDAFRSVKDLSAFFENKDIFDHYETAFAANVTEKPRYSIDVGFDHKEALLMKAKPLGLYKVLRQGDANQGLPFPDRSFRSVFSNIVYWLDDPQRTLNEISRVLDVGGRACLMLPDKALLDYSFYNQLFLKTGDENWRFLEKLDRGRFSDNIKQCKSGAEWEDIFRKAGLSVAAHKQHLSKTVIQMWDIGFRPLFPVLLKMTEALSEERHAEIKAAWIATLYQFLSPIAAMDNTLRQASTPAFHCYILEKRPT